MQRDHRNAANSATRPSVAVVGAGISGLSCARLLSNRGLSIQVFDKGRGAGGRMSTRRTNGGLHFDHGAQYFTARDPRFRRHVDDWFAQGLVAEWPERVVSLCKGQLDDSFTSADPHRKRFVATPGMNAICRHLGQGLPVEYATVVASASRTESGWQLRDSENHEIGKFDVLIAATPAPQASGLLSEALALSKVAANVTMTGCWALMLAFEAPIEAPYDGAFVRDSALSWIARDSGKPGRNAKPDCWVCHATPTWSEQHLDSSRERAMEWLLPAFFEATGVRRREPIHSAAHRWRYAFPSEPLTEKSLFDSEMSVGACGDWCSGPRVEGAFLSGMSVADRVMARYGHRNPGNGGAWTSI